MTRKRLLLNVPLDAAARARLAEGCELIGPVDGNIAPRLAEFSPVHALVASAVIMVNGEAMDRLPELETIGRLGIGVDNIDLEAATARGILVLHTPDAPAQSTAEHTVSFILALAKRTVPYDTMVRTGRWRERLDNPGCDVAGKTLGLIGLGRVGRLVARMCGAGLGMRVLAYDPYVKPAEMPAGVQAAASLTGLLSESDFISLHLPLSESTRHLIGAKEIECIKPGAFLINAARGGLVDSTALAQALKQGRVAGAALDVFDPEPPSADAPLLALPNVLLSPHIAWATREGARRMYEMLVSDTLEALAGRRPAHIANPEVWERARARRQ